MCNWYKLYRVCHLLTQLPNTHTLELFECRLAIKSFGGCRGRRRPRRFNIAFLWLRIVNIVGSSLGTTYETPKGGLRGGKPQSGEFGQINLSTVEGDPDSGGRDFHFRLRNHETGELATADSFVWSIFDIDDRNKDSGGVKGGMAIDLARVDDYVLYPSGPNSETIERMMATLQTVVVGGALDHAAARHLEQGGLPLLYAIMMKTGGQKLAMALEEILRVSVSTNGGPVIFHCQKGKDRTGVLAMLLQTCLQKDVIDSSDADVVDAYALSGELLGELPGQSKGDDDSSSSTSTIDWSYFRGSPREAMIDTLAWVRGQYGSIEEYLDSISFGEAKRAELRKHCQN